MAAVSRLLTVLVAVCLVAITCFAGVARAHGGTVAALITLDPKVPTPGQEALVTVKLLDVFSNQIQGVKLRVALGAIEKPLPEPTEFPETAPGTYTARMKYPPVGMAMITVDTELADGPYHTEFPLRVGPGGLDINGLLVQMVHADAGFGTPAVTPAAPQPAPATTGFRLSWVLIGVGGLIVLYGIYVARRS